MSLKLFSRFLNLALLLFITSVQGYKVNITKFGNCDDVTDVKVNITSVQYEYDNDGLCDTVHGKYFVRTKNNGANYELWITMYQCSTARTNQCNDNARKYIEPLHCNRFHGDDNGPWYMLSQSMRGSRCGAEVGEFDYVSAKLLPEYLTNYLVIDPNLLRHRIHMLFHKVGENGFNEHPRGCVNIEFNVII